jgi:hypothetical protein
LRSVDYMQLYTIAATMLMDYGRGAPASNARSYMTASAGYTTPLADGVHRYNIGQR